MFDSRPKGRGFKPHRRHCVVSLSKNINPSFVLVQPRKTRPFITERLLMGRKESNQTNKQTFERVYFAKFHFHLSVFPRNTGLGTDIFIKLEYIARSLVKIKSIPDWHLFISQMETKWTKRYAMTSHVNAYRWLELLFGRHTFHFNCFFDDFNCVFTQIRCLSRVLQLLK